LIQSGSYFADFFFSLCKFKVNNQLKWNGVHAAKKEASKVPNFLLGQSMGAAVALKAHLKQPQEWDGIILVAPMCRKQRCSQSQIPTT